MVGAGDKIEPPTAGVFLFVFPWPSEGEGQGPVEVAVGVDVLPAEGSGEVGPAGVAGDQRGLVQVLPAEQTAQGTGHQVTAQPTPPGTTHPAPGFEIPDRAERERRSAVLHATNAETGFWDDIGRPAPWSDGIEDWTTDTREPPAPEPGQPPF